jgi:hypothetical protein
VATRGKEEEIEIAAMIAAAQMLLQSADLPEPSSHSRYLTACDTCRHFELGVLPSALGVFEHVELPDCDADLLHSSCTAWQR